MYFTYKGISSEEMELRIIEFSPPSKAEEQTENTTIPGKANSLTKHMGQYKNTKKPLIFALLDRSNYRNVLSWLDGSGELVFSDEENRRYTVHMAGEGVCTRISDEIIEVETQVEFEPFVYAVDPTIVNINTSYTNVENPGNVYSEPIIKIKVTADDSPVLKGDVNFDGKITMVDAAMVFTEYSRIQAGEDPTFTEAQLEAADMDGDGVLSLSDVGKIQNIAAQGAVEDNPNAPAKYIIIDTNSAELMIGVPEAVARNGYEITVDCENMLLYYTNDEGSKINIMQCSYGDLPLLHTGINYMKYTGDASSVTVTVNERWR